MALQVGIAREIQKTLTWDILLGCSHGDIARSVIAGSLEFNGAVEIVWFFSQLRKTCAPGCTANIRTTNGTPLSESQLNWLETQGFPVSQWSSENATIGGAQESVQAAILPGRELGIKIKPVLPYPVHSPVMKSSADLLRSQSNRWQINAPKWPIFSSVWCKFISTSDEIREEALTGPVAAIRWMPSISNLVAEHEVNRFINIGPSNTLTGWILNSNPLKNVALVDAWEHLNPEASDDQST